MVKCCVPRCYNNSSCKTNNISFFKIPQDGNIREKWINTIGISSTNMGKDPRICSQHFDEKDYFKFSTCQKLKKGVIPKHRLRKIFNCEESALETYHCKDCDLKTDLLILFKKHIEQVHLGRSKNLRASQIVEYTLQTFICQNCTFETYSSLLWLKHVKIGCSSTEEQVENKELKWLKCDHCEYKATLVRNLRQHVRFKHTEWKVADMFQCDKCSYKTKYKMHLRKHNISKHLTSEDIPWLQCDKCPYRAKMVAHLRSHKTHQHTEFTQNDFFYCDKCTYKTKTNSNLNRHKKRLHLASDDVQWFQCDKCPYKAKLKQDLRSHKNNLNCENYEKEFTYS